jgi:hypothetical protein
MGGAFYCHTQGKTFTLYVPVVHVFLFIVGRTDFTIRKLKYFSKRIRSM